LLGDRKTLRIPVPLAVVVSQTSLARQTTATAAASATPDRNRPRGGSSSSVPPTSRMAKGTITPVSSRPAPKYGKPRDGKKQCP
jgi:hypothetical protein